MGRVGRGCHDPAWRRAHNQPQPIHAASRPDNRWRPRSLQTSCPGRKIYWPCFLRSRSIFALVPYKTAVSTIECERRPAAGLSASANQPAPNNRHGRSVHNAMQFSGSRPHFLKTAAVFRSSMVHLIVAADVEQDDFTNAEAQDQGDAVAVGEAHSVQPFYAPLQRMQF